MALFKTQTDYLRNIVAKFARGEAEHTTVHGALADFSVGVADKVEEIDKRLDEQDQRIEALVQSLKKTAKATDK